MPIELPRRDPTTQRIDVRACFPHATQAIVAFLRDRGIAGATVFRGIEGYGANARLHTTRILRLSEDLPILIEVVDQEDRLRGVLPELDALITDGLITLEKIDVVAYRGTARQHDVNEPPTPG